MFTPPPMEGKSPPPMDKFSPDKQFSPPPMDNYSTIKEFSPPPLDDFSPIKEFSPPPFGDFLPTREFSIPPLNDMSPVEPFSPPPLEDFSPPPLDDFSPSKEFPPLHFSPPSFGEISPSKEIDDNLYDDFEPTIQIEENNLKFGEILQLKPREILELKEESESRVNFLANLPQPKQDFEDVRQSSNIISKNININEEANFVENVIFKELNVTKGDDKNEQIVSVIVDNNKSKKDDDIEEVGHEEDFTENAQSYLKSDNKSISIEDLGINDNDKNSTNLKELSLSSQSTEDVSDELHLNDDPIDQEDNVKDADSVNDTEVIREQEDVKSKTSSIVEDNIIIDNADTVESVQLDHFNGDESIKEESRNEAATPEIDEFSFSDQEFEETKPLPAESHDFFASFGDANPTAGDANKDATNDGWGNFATEDDHQALAQESADDDFGDFDDFESASSVKSGSQGSYHILEEILRKVDASLEQLVQTVFTVPEISEDADSNESTSSLKELVFQDGEVWGSVEDPASAPALEFTWTEANIYSILLQTLNIDRNVVLDGENWRKNIPRNKSANLSSQAGNTAHSNMSDILLPTPVTVSLKPTLSNSITNHEIENPPREATLSLGNARERKSIDFSKEANEDFDAKSEISANVNKERVTIENVDEDDRAEYGHIQHDINNHDPGVRPTSRQMSISEQVDLQQAEADLHSPEFDWSLPDPVQDASLAQTNKEPFSLKLDSEVCSMKTNNKSLEEEVRRTLDAFPLLNFMQSPVLILPNRSPNPVRRLKSKNNINQR